MNLRSRIASVLAALIAGLALLAPLRAAAEPALWVAEGKEARVYMFGTVHVLPKDVSWRSPKLAAALMEAKELWLEIADIDSLGAQVASMFAILGQGVSPRRPLSSRLTSEEYATLDRVAKAEGLSAKQLNPMRPWLAAMMIEAGAEKKSGASASSGVDLELEKEFHQRRIPVRGFETVGQQIHVFSELPEKDELAFLIDTLKESDAADDGLDELVAAWSSGDAARLGRLVDEDMKKSSPALYEALIRRRNANFANQIEKLLAGKGTVFIAVGAAHLAGPDSVQNFLKAKGIAVTRR